LKHPSSFIITGGCHDTARLADTGGILDDPIFAATDFTALGYEIVRITLTSEPGTNLPIGDGLPLKV